MQLPGKPLLGLQTLPPQTVPNKRNTISAYTHANDLPGELVVNLQALLYTVAVSWSE